MCVWLFVLGNLLNLLSLISWVPHLSLRGKHLAHSFSNSCHKGLMSHCIEKYLAKPYRNSIVNYIAE